MDITRDEAEELVTDRAEWCQRVAQCTHLDADELRTKVTSCSAIHGDLLMLVIWTTSVCYLHVHHPNCQHYVSRDQ